MTTQISGKIPVHVFPDKKYPIYRNGQGHFCPKFNWILTFPLMSKSAPVKKPEISRIIFFSIQKHDQNLYDTGHEFVIKTLFPIITNSVNLS